MKINEQLTKNLQNIVESGDGYIKYSDGTMICYGTKDFPANNPLAYGTGLYRTSSIPFDDFAQTFINPPITSYSFASLSRNTNSAFVTVLYTATTTNPGRICIVKENNDQISGSISYISIGRWK